MNHANNLKKIRNANGINQNKMALDLGESIEKIRNIESGRTKLSVEIAIKIEQIYGTDLRWLLTGEGEMFRAEEGQGGAQGVEAKACEACGQAFGLARELQAKQEALEIAKEALGDKAKLLSLQEAQISKLESELEQEQQEVARVEETVCVD